MPSSKQKSSNFILGLLVFVLSFVGLVSTQAIFRQNAIAGIYLHGIPSESMMQTISIADLRDEPIKSLWNLHIQPPLFDFLRMLLAQISHHNDPLQLQYSVDTGLYMAWVLVYALICFLIFIWLSKITSNWFALAATFVFSVSPPMLLYATILEATFLSSFLILYFLYLLWKIKDGENVSPYVLALSFLLLFFTRSIFQWQWIILITPCLFLLKYPVQSIKRFLLISCIVVFAYLIKQYMLFGITSTSSFAGLNLCQSIQACKVHEVNPASVGLDSILPSALTREKKLTGAHNFNSLIDLKLNNAYMNDYRERLSLISKIDLFDIYYKNLLIYFQPSSNYASTNQLLVALPSQWRNYYEKIFSAPIFPVLLIISIFIWLKNRTKVQLIKSFGIAIPVSAIFVISILFESGENMRFKFFIEPALYIFIVSQLFVAGKYFWDYLLSILDAIIGKANSS